MYIVPIKNILINITTVAIKTYWTESSFSGDKFARKPYQWTVTMDVTAQSHSSQQTRVAYQYNGLDIFIGDWICSGPRGTAHKIISISSQTSTQVICVLEDYDRFNTVTDISRQGNGAPNMGYGYCFTLGNDGLPLVSAANNGAFSYPYVTDLQTRFEYRNYIKNNVRVYQENNGFVIGDVIFMDTDGLYKTIEANKDNRDNISKIVGTVTDISIPGTGYFTYSPRGEYKPAMTTVLPDASPGSLIYLDTENAGQLTATEPKIYATPIYIRLGSSTEAIYLMGGSGSGSSGPLGYNASIYTVNTNDDMNALDTTLINPGDQVYVNTDTDGIWGLYIASSIDETQAPPVVTWTKISDEFSSESDSGTIEKSITYQTSSSLDLVTIKSGVRVINVIVEVTSVFSADAILTIGDDLVNNRLVDNDDLDLTTIGSYSIIPNYQYTSLSTIKSYFTAGASSSGQATITVSYL